MTQKKAEILLATVIAARATSLLFSKIAMNGMGIFNLLGPVFDGLCAAGGGVFQAPGATSSAIRWCVAPSWAVCSS